MTIVQILERWKLDIGSEDDCYLGPCSESEIIFFESKFIELFNFQFPNSYKKILGIQNGIQRSGLVIWPIKHENPRIFDETIFEANFSLGKIWSSKHIFFGNIDERFFLYDLEMKQFSEFDYRWGSPNRSFKNDEEMFQLILEEVD